MEDNKKYYYLRVKEDFYESEEMIILQNMPSGYLYSDILMKLYLRSLKDGGKLIYHSRIPYSPEVLASVCRHECGVVEKALDIFQKLGLIEVLDNGTIFMMDIQNFIGHSSTEADRKREKRTMLCQTGNESVKEIPGIGKPDADESQDEKEGRKSNKAISTYTVTFEEFWKEYPRKGDKTMAYKKYNARIKDGFSPGELLTAAKAYAEQCERERTESRYIKLGKTFLGESMPFLEYLSNRGERREEDAPDDSINPFRKQEE